VRLIYSGWPCATSALFYAYHGQRNYTLKNRRTCHQSGDTQHLLQMAKPSSGLFLPFYGCGTTFVLSKLSLVPIGAAYVLYLQRAAIWPPNSSVITASACDLVSVRDVSSNNSSCLCVKQTVVFRQKSATPRTSRILFSSSSIRSNCW